jgi:hypothetical protein
MIKKLRTIVLGTVAIAAVIALFATGPEVGQVWSQVANAQEDLKTLREISGFYSHPGVSIEAIEAEIAAEHHEPPPPELEPHH